MSGLPQFVAIAARRLSPLALGAALLVMPYEAEAAAIVSISPVSFDVEVGESFVVDIAIEGVEDLYAFQFDLSFSPSILRADDLLEGAFLTAGGGTFFIPGIIDDVLGTISFTASSLLGPGPGVTGSGVLATLRFTSLAAGVSPIALSGAILLDSGLADIDFVSADGAVTVREDGTVPEPTSSSLLLLAVGVAIRRRWALRRSR